MILKVIFFFNKLIAQLFYVFYDKAEKKDIFLSQEESIIELSNTNKSLIRWGDGESTILTGGNLFFQQNSFKLFKYFFKILKSYRIDSNYLIATPNEFLIHSKDELSKRGKYNLWKYTRFVFRVYFKKNRVKYLDSFLFRENTTLNNLILEKLWDKEQYIFFIHNNFKYFKDFQNKYSNKKVFFIQVTSANSFKQIRNIIDKVYQKQLEVKAKKEDLCILISAGPASKAFVFELSQKGYRSLDMGHYFDYKFYNLRRHGK